MILVILAEPLFTETLHVAAFRMHIKSNRALLFSAAHRRAAWTGMWGGVTPGAERDELLVVGLGDCILCILRLCRTRNQFAEASSTDF